MENDPKNEKESQLVLLLVSLPFPSLLHIAMVSGAGRNLWKGDDQGFCCQTIKVVSLKEGTACAF